MENKLNSQRGTLRFFAIGGILLSLASAYYNARFGWEQGHVKDVFTGIVGGAAMAGFAILKDGGFSIAISGKGVKVRFLAFVVGSIGLSMSLLAALGASGETRNAKSNPLQAEIDAYNVAVKTEADEKAKITGKIISVAEAEGALSRVIVDATIWKRTQSCTSLDKRADGTPYKAAQAAANREACEPHAEAASRVSVAKEQADAGKKIAAARAIIAKGKPASADSQVSSVMELFSLDRLEGVTAWLNLGYAVSVELGSLIVWAIYSAMGGTSVVSLFTSPKPTHRNTATEIAEVVEVSQPPKSRPSLVAVNGQTVRGRISDDELEALVLADIAKGRDKVQADYAGQLSVSIATVSRAFDRLIDKPGAQIAEERVGTRRILRKVG